MKDGGDLKVLQGSGDEVLFGVEREIEVFKSPLRQNVAARWWGSDMFRPWECLGPDIAFGHPQRP